MWLNGKGSGLPKWGPDSIQFNELLGIFGDFSVGEYQLKNFSF